jgi:glutaredoxin 3
LAEKGVAFTEYDVSVDSKGLMEMVRLTGQRGVPVITVDGEVIIGFNRPRLEQLLSPGQGRNRISLGISVADANNMVRKPPLKTVSGAYVGAVKPFSRGAAAGLQVGDIIIEVNGRTINTASDLEKVLSSISSAKNIPLSYIREQNVLRTEIVT